MFVYSFFGLTSTREVSGSPARDACSGQGPDLVLVPGPPRPHPGHQLASFLLLVASAGTLAGPRPGLVPGAGGPRRAPG